MVCTSFYNGCVKKAKIVGKTSVYSLDRWCISNCILLKTMYCIFPYVTQNKQHFSHTGKLHITDILVNWFSNYSKIWAHNDS